MLVTNLLVSGSVAYAGVKTLVDHHRSARARQRENDATYVINRPSNVRTANAPQSPPKAKATMRTDDVTPGGPTLQERRQRTAAATAMWLGIGGFFWPPLTIIGAPLTIYSSISIFESAGRSLYSEGRLRPSVINSILLVSTLVTENYLPAAAISWLHHSFRQFGQRLQVTGEQMAADIENDLGDLLRQAAGGSPQMVWMVQATAEGQGVEVRVPFTDLKTGDILVANRGELIPVNGVVTAGEATLNLLLLTHSSVPMSVRTGERVYKGAFVVEGNIRIQVDQIQ